MLIALRQRGQLTASELAQELEVSPRTILRDVETLSAAGVPIYAVKGSGGGIRLLGGFGAAISEITGETAAGLLLAGQPELAAVLGLGAAARAAPRSMLAALPPPLVAPATAIDDWFILDPSPSPGDSLDPRLIRLASRAAQLRLELRNDFGPVLRPLGLVLSRGDWLLVHLDGSRPVAMSLTQLPDDYRLGRPFARPANLTLRDAWLELNGLE